MKFVRLENNKVVEIIPDYALPVEKWYGEEFASRCIESPDEVEQGWFYDSESKKFVKELPIKVEQTRDKKLSELSSACNTAIEKGTTIQLSDGTSENFSYTLADQANVSEMFNAVVMGATEYPYHANDSECKMYSAKDIITIYSALSSMKTAQITYHNQLKQYVKSLENSNEIRAVIYGQELTGEYLEAYNTLIAQAQTQLEAVLARIVSLENV